LLSTFVDPNNPPWYLEGLPPAEISLVYQAFYGFGRGLDRLGVMLCLISTIGSLLVNGDESISFSLNTAIFTCINYQFNNI
jgi:hypothetical protein